MLTSSSHGMLSMGYPLWKKERKKKSCSPYLSNKAGKQNIKYVAVAEAAKTGSYKLKAEKMAARIKTRQDLPSPHPRALLSGVLSRHPLPQPWVNAVELVTFRSTPWRGGGRKATDMCTVKACRDQTEAVGSAPVTQGRAALAGSPPCREEVPSPCSRAAECLLPSRPLWEAAAAWIHQETSYLQDP